MWQKCSKGRALSCGLRKRVGVDIASSHPELIISGAAEDHFRWAQCPGWKQVTSFERKSDVRHVSSFSEEESLSVECCFRCWDSLCSYFWTGNRYTMFIDSRRYLRSYKLHSPNGKHRHFSTVHKWYLTAGELWRKLAIAPPLVP